MTDPILTSNVGKDAQMEIEDTPGSSLRSLQLSAVDIFIDKVKGNGDNVFHSFEIEYETHCHVCKKQFQHEHTNEAPWTAFFKSYVKERMHVP